MSVLVPGALSAIQTALVSQGRAPRELSLEQLSTEELEARVLLNQERLRLTEQGAFWGGFGSAFWAVGRGLK